jgi:hypothetical protein
MNEQSKLFAEVAECILTLGAYKAIKYIDEKTTLKATRRRYDSKILKGKNHPIEILFTLGRPNYEEREFIKLCKKAGELFPVKKIQLKFPKV